MDLVGKDIGPYRLLAVIGRGGTAEVYKALHIPLDRQVAVKVLLSEASRDPDWVRRFRREAQMLGKLDHPHILPIFDAGEDQGRSYLVMKYIADGVTLRSQLNGEPWPLDRVLPILDQVTEALSSAHESGVVHRDVKPSNILVTPENRCLVFDFGIAKPLRSLDPSTEEGFIVGTPEFMSPEQCRGDRIDHRSDIYSLGIMMYQLLTGHVPFRAESPIGVLMKHLTEPLPIPPKNAELPQEVNDVLRRALARSPQDRFPSAREFCQKLHEAAGHAPTVTIVARTVRRPLWRRLVDGVHQVPQPRLALAATLGLAIGLGGVILSYQLLSLIDDRYEVARGNGAGPASDGWIQEESRSSVEIASSPSTGPSGPIASRRKLGFLRIESDQPAEVLLDGGLIGSAPGEFDSLSPGRHHLKLRSGPVTVWEGEISIYAASTTYVTKKSPTTTDAETLLPSVTSRPVAAPDSLTSRRPPPPPAIRLWTGYLTDEQCRELGGQQGELHLKSALRCIREGWRPMLYTKSGELHFIDGLERIRLVEDAPLVFSGWLDPRTNTIYVTSTR